MMETKKTTRLSTEARLLENTLEFSYRFRLLLYDFLQVYDVEQWHLRQALETYLKRHSARKTHYLLFLGHDPFAAHIYWIMKKYPHFAVEVVERASREVHLLAELFHRLGIRNICFYKGEKHHLPSHPSYDYVAAIYPSSMAALPVEGLAKALKPTGVFVGLFKGITPEKAAEFRKRVRRAMGDAGFRRIKFRWIYGRPAKWSYRLSIWPIRLLRLSWVFLPFVLLYYVVMMPVVALLNYMDSHMVHRGGRVMMVRARKQP